MPSQNLSDYQLSTIEELIDQENVTAIYTFKIGEAKKIQKILMFVKEEINTIMVGDFNS